MFINQLYIGQEMKMAVTNLLRSTYRITHFRPVFNFLCLLYSHQSMNAAMKSSLRASICLLFSKWSMSAATKSCLGEPSILQRSHHVSETLTKSERDDYFLAIHEQSSYLLQIIVFAVRPVRNHFWLFHQVQKERFARINLGS